LIFVFLVGGCAAGLAPPLQLDRPSAIRHLDLGECLLAQGDYAGARHQAEQVLEQFPGQADDRALHLEGMALVHPANPQADLQAGAEAFRRIVSHHPDSPLVVEARSWLAVIDQLAANQQAQERLEGDKRALEARLAVEKDKRRKLEERLQQMKAIDLSVE
jgi:hypothetical protein